MRAELVSLNPCPVHFLSRAVVNLCWYDCTINVYLNKMPILYIGNILDNCDISLKIELERL